MAFDGDPEQVLAAAQTVERQLHGFVACDDFPFLHGLAVDIEEPDDGFFVFALPKFDEDLVLVAFVADLEIANSHTIT